MSEKVSVKVPAHLAGFVRPDATDVEKLKVVRDELDATPLERATLLFFLCYDRNPLIRAEAISAMRGLPLDLVKEIASAEDSHPRLLDLVARIFYNEERICSLLTVRSDLLSVTLSFLGEKLNLAKEAVEVDVEQLGEPAGGVDEEPDEDRDDKDQKEEGEADKEEFKSKYQLAQTMGVGDKIKMALTGDKEWRMLLIKDSNKLVSGAVVKNPRITDPEILAISKSAIQNDEILRIICHNKEWVKNYEIRKALVLNNKTPLPVALRFMGFLSEKDIATIAKSKNVSSVLSNNARRLMASKKKS